MWIVATGGKSGPFKMSLDSLQTGSVLDTQTNHDWSMSTTY